MALGARRLVPLPLETQSRIRSAAQIPSLSEVILELVKNSLDANAGHVNIRLDFQKGYCSILDDGDGIVKEEFLEDGGLAQLYYTSKSVNSDHIYGRYGRFLASLASLSLLSITSRHCYSESSNSIVLTDGERIASSTAVSDEESGLQKHGTKVTVHNLFGRMPVRVKQRLARAGSRTEAEKEFSLLKHMLTGLILASSRPFILDMHDGVRKYFHRPTLMVAETLNPDSELIRIVSALAQAGLVDSADTKTWKQASIKSSSVSLQAVISLQPAPSKLVQFMSLNHHVLPVNLAKSFFDLVNVLFEKSSFGQSSDITNDEDCQTPHQRNPRTKSLTRSQKEVNRWPMFFIKIDSDAGLSSDEAQQIDANNLLPSAGGLLQALIIEFLRSTGFEPCGQRRRTKPPSTLAQSCMNASNFDSWSRIKSSDGTPPDMLSGLPFMTRHDPGSNPLQTIQQIENEFDTEEIVQWNNPRGGNTLQLNPRTGMALPSRRLNTTPKRHVQRKLDDVMSSLSQYLPESRIERTFNSITPTYDVPEWKSNVRDEHICILQSKDISVHITGPTSMEPRSLNLSKDDLQAAQVHGQVDGKFILASLVTDHRILVMIDQHAADERVKVEELFQQLCTGTAVPLLTPIVFEVSQQELQRFQKLQTPISVWQIHYSVSNSNVRVSALPELIVEKCRIEPKLLINLLRKEIWREHLPVATNSNHWLTKLSTCPQGVLDMLISRACRSAIMFNDQLSIEQCQRLIRRLSGCLFPLQCAHGRPSLTIVAQIQDTEVRRGSTFGTAWKDWTD